MGCTTGRCFTLSVLLLQLLSVVTRQVFDFLGYMWAPIIANFICIICAILGFFGVYQFRAKYIIVYCFWSLLWIAWNAFITCFYLEVGSLSLDSEILDLGTGSRSWWRTNGIGCEAKYNHTSGGDVSVAQDLQPYFVEGCLVQYQHVECIQAVLQIALSILAIIGCGCILYRISNDDDSSKMPRSGSALPPYSIEYQHHPPPENNDGPMTPRKVKRRSTSRNSTRSSSRTNRRYRNPVTKMMDRSFETSSNDSYYVPGNFYRRDPAGGVCNLAFDNVPPNPFVMNLNGQSRAGYNGESETVI